MPLYQVQHSYPLSTEQKFAVAQAITKLHSTAFLTPSLYVNVSYIPSEPQGDFFLAGKPMLPASPSRITASVRMSPNRTKEMFDEVALKVEAIWYDIVNRQDKSNGAVNGSHGATKEEAKAKKLHGVVFQGIIAAAENGILLPSASAEGTWLKDNMRYFEEQAKNGDEMFADMLQEIKERPDLQALVM